MTRLAFAPFLCVLLLAPFVLLATPNEARAGVDTVVSDTAPTTVENLAENTFSAIKNAASYLLDVTNTAANYARYIKDYILSPLAFLMSGDLLKKITSSILGFVSGSKNPSGKPLYIQDLNAYMQNVGDVQAYAFLNAFQSQSNSPFKSAIVSSLRATYLSQTTNSGFFAANKSTLGGASSDLNSFLAGNWSAGGATAWFALTTQDQNNPYALYYRAQDQMVRSVEAAQAAKLAQANWNQGFRSWCGTINGNTAGATDLAQAQSICESSYSSQSDVDTCVDNYKAATSGGEQTPIGGDYTTVTCPSETETAGDICGCTNAGGCYDSATGTYYDANTYVLPSGWSCPDGSNFDNLYGGCEYTADGVFTSPVDANGNAISTDAGTDTSPQTSTDNFTDQTSTSATAAQAVDSLTANAHGVDNFDHKCWANVRQSECDAYGSDSAFCKPQGQNSTGVLTAAGWNTVTTLNNVGSNSSISSSLQKGDIVQVYTGGTYPAHVCAWNGKNCIDGTIQTNIVPYSSVRSSSSAKVVVWRAPSTALGKISRVFAFLWHLLPFTGPAASPRPQSNLAAVLLAQEDTSISYSFNDSGGGGGGGDTNTTDTSSSYSSGDYGGGGSSSSSSGGSSSLKMPVPGDNCTRPDGTMGKVMTPGSIIKDYLSKALGADIDRLVRIGDISTQVSGIMSNLSTIFSTINLAAGLFGGSSSGLLNFSSTDSYTSPFASYLNNSTYLGLTTSDVYANAAKNTAVTADLPSRTDAYEAAWNSIKYPADQANSALETLVNSCPTQASGAQGALASVQGVLAGYAAASATIASARALIQKVNDEASSGSGSYASDLASEQLAAPSSSDVAQAQNDALNTGAAYASPVGSLNVGGGSVLDRMNLVGYNAQAIRNNPVLCPPPVANPTSSTETTLTPSGGEGG